jgi:uncharacterized damage-inducible protein DinB
MLLTDSQCLFNQAFDTFKAFDNLTLCSSSAEQQTFPASIWQILQHLLVWQSHQLALLQGTASAETFDERRSWDAARVPPSEAALQTAVTQFKLQLTNFQTWASQAKGDAQQVLAQALILQDVALHLSFHLGEVVLMRRLQGSYPLPAHMQEFLQA